MHGYVQRAVEAELQRALARAPATLILGPRQCGKSTLARRVLGAAPAAVYLDLQDRRDLNKLNEPELFFERHRRDLVCLDEIQQLPEFFGILRAEIDRDRRPGRFLILGSASRELIRQSSESLAGRVAHVDLAPFAFGEVAAVTDVPSLWLRGGFPDSLLAADDGASFAWRRDFVRTFLERDIPAAGLATAVPAVGRLWRLLAHYHGQTANYSHLAAALEVATQTLKRYLEVLEQTFMLRLLPPLATNLKKRLTKAPKLYLRDSGILHQLLAIEDYDTLLAHPAMGASWEGLGIENVLVQRPGWRPAFVRTSNGAEIDLVLERGRAREVFEFKASKAPTPSRGFFELLDDLQPDRAWIVAPVAARYEYRAGVWVTGLGTLDDTH